MSRPGGKTLYALLGVSPTASQPELDAAFLTLQKQLQEVVLDARQRDERLSQLEAAYQQLSNPLRRSVYDASLAKGQASTVQLPSSQAKAAKTLDMGRGPSLGLIALAVLVVFGALYFYFVYRQQALLSDFRSDAMGAQQRAMQRQEEILRAQEAAYNGTPEEQAAQKAAWEAERLEREARREQEQRERDFDQWNNQVENEQQRAEREQQRKERERQRELEQEKRAADRQEEIDRRAAEARVENDRRGLMQKFLSEGRYNDARQIAKTEYELSQIERAEKYGR